MCLQSMYHSITLQIQMKVRRCTTSNYCTCAIAARAASDVYVIDRCDENQSKWKFDFMSCEEDILHVVKKKNDEFNYEVCMNFLNLFELV